MASSYLDLYLFDRYQLTGEINTNQKKAMEIELVQPGHAHVQAHTHPCHLAQRSANKHVLQKIHKSQGLLKPYHCINVQRFLGGHRTESLTCLREERLKGSGEGLRLREEERSFKWDPKNRNQHQQHYHWSNTGDDIRGFGLVESRSFTTNVFGVHTVVY